MRKDVRISHIIKALGNDMRLKILKNLYKYGSLSFTELMRNLGMDPRRDTGKFGYHLKILASLNLIKTNEREGEYRLTELGHNVVELISRLEEIAKRERRLLLVRKTLPGIEEFDRSKIVDTLVREASVPKKIAEEIAQEVEKKLLRLNVKYLTAPLIRELVNVVLVEKGYEEYRHTLTRLGMPVYDVHQLIEGERTLRFSNIESVAGKAVIREYTLLRVIPRYVADDHLSGLIHIPNLGRWILYPDTLCHDIEVFLKGEVDIAEVFPLRVSVSKPSTLREILGAILSILIMYSNSIGKYQVLDHFNYIIAPYIKNLDRSVLIRELRYFMRIINELCLGTSLNVIVIADLGCASMKEFKNEETYSDYFEEAMFVTKALLNVIREEANANNLLFKPLLYLKIYEEAFKHNEEKELLELSLEIARKYGLVAYINMKRSWEYVDAYYNGDGIRFETKSERELGKSTFRTGILGSVSLNLPRIAVKARNDEDEFMNILETALEACITALSCKEKVLEKRLRFNHLPLLNYEIKGLPYYQLEHSIASINMVGLIDAIALLSGSYPHESNRAKALLVRILKRSYNFINEVNTGKFRVNISATSVSNENIRFAELDFKEFPETRRILRSRGTAYYIDDPAHLPISLRDLIKFSGVLHEISRGGHIVNITLAEPPPPISSLYDFLQKAIKGNVKFITFSRDLTYCRVCKRLVGGYHMKCPFCSFSGSKISHYGKVKLKYENMDTCPLAKRIEYLERYRYVIL